jgi:SAM-dependent methyltransferase
LDVRVKYYFAEHEAGYRRIAHEGHSQWSDLFEDTWADDFETFPNRQFLDGVLPRLALPSPSATSVLEYGCGTGPAACFLASRGYCVEAVDVVPEAIMLARRFASDRGLRVTFRVEDACDLVIHPATKRYDLIVDIFCLQSIVTDADRRDLLAGVHARLKPSGYYLISTAMYEPGRSYGPPFHYDEHTGVCYQALAGEPAGPDAVQFDGTWYQPYRRHVTSAAIRQELAGAGFEVLHQEGRFGGDLVCSAMEAM